MGAKRLTLKQIISLQKRYGVTSTQDSINSGTCWRLEGSVGRFAMSTLENGACLLPDVEHRDYYGNRVPARHMLQPDTKGTLGNAQLFWDKVKAGYPEYLDYLEDNFTPPAKKSKK